MGSEFVYERRPRGRGAKTPRGRRKGRSQSIVFNTSFECADVFEKIHETQQQLVKNMVRHWYNDGHVQTFSSTEHDTSDKKSNMVFFFFGRGVSTQNLNGYNQSILTIGYQTFLCHIQHPFSVYLDKRNFYSYFLKQLYKAFANGKRKKFHKNNKLMAYS